MKSRSKLLLIAIALGLVSIWLVMLPPPSLSMRMVSLIIARHGPTKTLQEQEIEYKTRVYPQPAAITRSLRSISDVEEKHTLGFAVYELTPKKHASGWHIIYFHGGGYVSELVKAHWDIIEELMRATGATISVPIYPLAPEHDHTKAFVFLDALYMNLANGSDREKLILCGDSSGGNAALLQAIRARDQKHLMPKHIILFAPWLDLTASNPEIALVQKDDIMLRASETIVWGQWWAGKDEPSNPHLSPIFAELDGLPPIQIYQGTHDITWPDAKKLRDRINAAGGKVRLYETIGGFHDFMAATFTPEAKAVYKQIEANLEKHIQ